MPAEPPSHLIYRHEARVRIVAARTVGEPRHHLHPGRTGHPGSVQAGHPRDCLWALIAPLAMLGIFTIIFSRTKSLATAFRRDPVPDLRVHRDPVLDLLLPGSLGTGGTSLLTNNALMSKTQFPRECFPLETDPRDGGELGPGVDPPGTALRVLSLRPAPPPLSGCHCSMLIEVLFTVGLTLGVSALDHPDARPRAGASHHHPCWDCSSRR